MIARGNNPDEKRDPIKDSDFMYLTGVSRYAVEL